MYKLLKTYIYGFQFTYIMAQQVPRPDFDYATAKTPSNNRMLAKVECMCEY